MKLLFLLSLLSARCVLSGVVSDEPKVIGSPAVPAAVGKDVILPCHLEPPFDVHNLTVEWRRNKTAVHIYRSKGDDPDSQDERFKNRTLLFHDEMVKGNISLKLFNVTEQDAGIYTCFVPKLQSQVRKGNVTLKVVPKGGEGGEYFNPKNLSIAEIIGISLGVIVIVIGIGIFIVIKRKEDPNYVASPVEDQNL